MALLRCGNEKRRLRKLSRLYLALPSPARPRQATPGQASPSHAFTSRNHHQLKRVLALPGRAMPYPAMPSQARPCLAIIRGTTTNSKESSPCHAMPCRAKPRLAAPRLAAPGPALTSRNHHQLKRVLALPGRAAPCPAAHRLTSLSPEKSSQALFVLLLSMALHPCDEASTACVPDCRRSLRTTRDRLHSACRR